jgi:ABC-type lipoprotein release transport system permease subunit
MAWRNLWRNRRRTLVTLAAGGLGLMFAQGYTTLAEGVWGQMIDDGVRSGSGHLSLHAPGYLSSREPDLTFPEGGLRQGIGRVPGVAAVLPRLFLPGLAQSARGSRGAAVVGVDPAPEWGVNPFARSLVEGRLPGQSGGREALVGRDLHKSLGLKVGGKLVLMVQGPGGELRSELVRVGGVVATGVREMDAGTVFVGLEFARRLSGREGALHELAVVLRDARGLEDALAAAREAAAGNSAVEVHPWQEAMPDLFSHFRADFFSLRLIIGFVYLIVGIGIVNTLLMSVLERTREFGVMRALGVPTRFLVGLVLAEGALMGLLAAVGGSLLGTGVTAAMARWGIDLAPLYRTDQVEVSGVVFSTVLRARWAPGSMVALAVVVALLYLVGAVYPSWRTTRVRPVESLKFG